MRIYFTPSSNINNSITSQDVVSAYVVQKQDQGYIVNIGGKEVFAHCLLDLDMGDFLKLKVVESSPSQIVLKVVEHEVKSQNPGPVATLHLPSPQGPPLDLSQTQEAQAAFNLLAKLNLPIIKERVAFIMELFNILVKQEKTEPALPLLKNLPFESVVSTFCESIAQYINDGHILSENQLLELLENFSTANKDKAFSFHKASPVSKKKTMVLKEQLALKAINILHRNHAANNIFFFALPVPVYQNIYFKLTDCHTANDDSHALRISFIVNTKNLGAILVDLIYSNGKVTASSVFEDKKAMDAVKHFLSTNKDLSSIVKAMELKVGKVSLKDFFFEDIKKQPITSGINIKV